MSCRARTRRLIGARSGGTSGGTPSRNSPAGAGTSRRTSAGCAAVEQALRAHLIRRATERGGGSCSARDAALRRPRLGAARRRRRGQRSRLQRRCPRRRRPAAAAREEPEGASLSERRGAVSSAGPKLARATPRAPSTAAVSILRGPCSSSWYRSRLRGARARRLDDARLLPHRAGLAGAVDLAEDVVEEEQPLARVGLAAPPRSGGRRLKAQRPPVEPADGGAARESATKRLCTWPSRSARPPPRPARSPGCSTPSRATVPPAGTRPPPPGRRG